MSDLITHFVYSVQKRAGNELFESEPIHGERGSGMMSAIYPDRTVKLGLTRITPASISDVGMFYSIECAIPFHVPALVTTDDSVEVVYHGPVRLHHERESKLHSRLGHRGWRAAALNFGGMIGILLEGDSSPLLNNVALVYGKRGSTSLRTLEICDIDYASEVLASAETLPGAWHI